MLIYKKVVKTKIKFLLKLHFSRNQFFIVKDFYHPSNYNIIIFFAYSKDKLNIKPYVIIHKYFYLINFIFFSNKHKILDNPYFDISSGISGILNLSHFAIYTSSLSKQ
mgnify:CR=1 FL=1